MHRRSPAKSRYSKAVIHGSTVYLAGNVARDPGATAAEQARMILKVSIQVTCAV